MAIQFKKVNALPASPTAADDGVYFVKSGDKYTSAIISKGNIIKLDAVTLEELNTAINNINTQLASGLRVPDPLDCSANPNTPAGAKKGDTWLVTKAGKFGGASGIVVQIGDMIICTADTPTSGTATTNFFVVESNQQPASETVAGYVRLSTTAEAKAGTNTTVALSPARGKEQISELAVTLTGNQTVAGVKTFSSSPVVPNAVNANQAVNKGQLDSAIASASLEWSSEEW